jgi:hypothetical protein
MKTEAHLISSQSYRTRLFIPHPEKCVVIQISSKRSTIPANYTLHNHQLDVVDSSKYFLNSSTELAVDAADRRLFHSRMDLGKKEFR